jgi:hypothetical protein
MPLDTKTEDRPPQKPVGLQLRFKEQLRSRLAAAAARNEASLNSEIIRRLEDSFTQEDVMGAKGLGPLVRAFASAIEQTEGQTGKSWVEDWETFAAVRVQMVRAIAASMPPHPQPEKLGEAMEAEQAARAAMEEARAAYEELVPAPQPNAFGSMAATNALAAYPPPARSTLGAILEGALRPTPALSPLERFIEENPDKEELVTERLNAYHEAGQAWLAANERLKALKAPIEDARDRGLKLAQRLLSAPEDEL